MKKDKNNKKKKSDWIVPFVICSVFIFTGIAIFLQFVTSTELSSTLITCFYAFCTGELWMLSSIKKAKIYTDIDNDGIPDDITMTFGGLYSKANKCTYEIVSVGRDQTAE